MKAARIHSNGGTDVIQVENIPKPQLQSDQVCIQLKAAALNHLDIWVRKGIPGTQFPLILGSDGAGIICQTGKNVKKFTSGDRVVIQPLVYCGNCSHCLGGRENLCHQFGILGESTDGTNCEYIVLDENKIEPKPPGLSFEESAAFPLIGQTAYQMLVKRAKIQPNEVVLVWGASSGVGHMAVQIAKAKGAKVIATAGSKEKCLFAADLGADLVLDHYHDDIPDAIKSFSGKVDVVFEHVGSSTWETSMRVLIRGGRLVTCGATTGHNVSLDLRHLFFKQQSILGSTMGDANSFIEVIKMINEGTIKPKVDKIYSLDDIHSAHKYLEKSNQIGKVVISI